jgi:hypothetical protein
VLWLYLRVLLSRLINSENTVYGEGLISILKAPKGCLGYCLCPQRRKGLGVIDLKKQNDALLTKNLDKFFNKKDIP